MAQTLSVSSLINVQIILSAAAAQGQDLNTGMIFGNSSTLSVGERARLYYSSDAVGADFGSTSPEYLAAVAYFSQLPQPKKVYIARYANAPYKGSLVGGPLTSANSLLSAWTAITSGSLTIPVDGVSIVLTNLNFSSATSLNGVASILQSALVAAGATGATVTYFASTNNFVIKSGTTGTSSSVGYATAGTIQTMGGFTLASGAASYAGNVAETAVSAYLDAASRFGQKFYGVFFCGVSNTDDLALASAIESSATKRSYWTTVSDPACLIPGNTVNHGYDFYTLNVKKTGWIYSSTNPYAGASLMARAININYNANNSVITLMYKSLPGIVAESISDTQAAAVKALNGNVFANYDNGTAIVQFGTMASGDYIDIITGVDWLAVTIQNNLYNILYTTPTKVPQTDAGEMLLIGGAEQVCAQGVLNGLLAPGVWTQQGFGELNQGDFLSKGYYVYADPMSQQLSADRAARKAQPIQVAGKISGAIHTVDVLVNVNR